MQEPTEFQQLIKALDEIHDHAIELAQNALYEQKGEFLRVALDVLKHKSALMRFTSSE